MVGRISPQTPESGTHQHCSGTLRTARYSLPSLLAAPLFSYSYELFFLQALYFHNHLRCPGVWGTHRSPALLLCVSVSRWQSPFFQGVAASLPTFVSPRPLFSTVCSLFFQKHPGGGYARKLAI